MKTKRTFRIQNNSGDWWTGSCFGVEQCAEKYASLDDLPTEIDGLGLEIHDDDPSKPDARYYAADMDGELLMESEAGVRMTAEETDEEWRIAALVDGKWLFCDTRDGWETTMWNANRSYHAGEIPERIGNPLPGEDTELRLVDGTRYVDANDLTVAELEERD